jgi:hypothetical protein
MYVVSLLLICALNYLNFACTLSLKQQLFIAILAVPEV